ERLRFRAQRAEHEAVGGVRRERGPACRSSSGRAARARADASQDDRHRLARRRLLHHDRAQARRAMITPEWRPSENQLRQFSGICLLGFPALGFVLWRSSGSVWPFLVLMAIGILVCSIGLARPRAVYPVYVALLAVSLPIGWVVSGILLRLVFFAVIT